MDTRQQLVEEWKAKLEANSQPPAENAGQFGWVRQIYTLIYRFLVSCYGEGKWRGGDDASSLNAGLPSTASRMPFVESAPVNDGLLPKSPERIRAALESIHSSNPGIATPGTTVGVEDDTWVVVAARKKSQFSRTVLRMLAASGIEARLLNRTTDIAVVVRHKDFQRAVAVVQSAGQPRRIRVTYGIFKWTMEPSDEDSGEARKFRISKRVDPAGAVGVLLLILSILTFLAVVLLFHDTLQRATPVAAVTALWIAGLLASWLWFRGHNRR